MDDNGFTLIELIVVIGLLALMATLIGTNMVSLQQKQNLKSYENYKQTIADAACVLLESDKAFNYFYLDRNLKIHFDSSGSEYTPREYCLHNGECYVGTFQLIDSGYLDFNLKDPSTGIIVEKTIDKNDCSVERVKVSFQYGIKKCTYYRGSCEVS